MLSTSTQSISQILLLSFISFSRFTTAALSLQELQPIANFPSACQAAYQTTIAPCPDANSFTLAATQSGQSICNKECFAALGKATVSIQQACQGSSAPPGTVIAHAFIGDLPGWLCTFGSGGGAKPSTGSNPIPSIPSLSSAASTANPTANPTTTSSVSASNTKGPTSTDPLVGSGSGSGTKTQNLPSSTSSISTQSSSQINEATSKTTSTAASTSSSSSRTSQTLQPGGGGSPFDQVVPNTGVSRSQSPSMVSLVIVIAFASIFCI